jgi:hypothetical protein
VKKQRVKHTQAKAKQARDNPEIPVVDQRQHNMVKAIRILHQSYSVGAAITSTFVLEPLLTR